MATKKKTRNVAEILTMELPGIKRRVGRPRKADAMTTAERQRKFVESRLTVKLGPRIVQTITSLADQFDLTKDYVAVELFRFALCNKNWKKTGFPSQVTKTEEGGV